MSDTSLSAAAFDPPPGDDEQTLVQRIVAGDRKAFELLMRRHNRRLFRLARATLRNDADAEDALQEAYIAAYRSMGQFRGAAAVGTPVVVLYALTNPQHTPWQVESRVLSHDVPCKFCYKSVCPLGHQNCLRLVTPQQVVDAAQELLSLDLPQRSSRLAWAAALAATEGVAQ